MPAGRWWHLFSVCLGHLYRFRLYFNNGRLKTNAEGLIGKCGIVLEDINNLHAVGLVQVDGMEWSARATDECTIEKGQEVVIRAISGVKLIVEEKKTEG